MNIFNVFFLDFQLIFIEKDNIEMLNKLKGFIHLESNRSPFRLK